ncbi:MAG: guanylate kinase [Balneolaceae bacterium]
MNKKQGNILILAAPSGGGKSTMAHRLLKDFKNIRFSVSATTRAPRPGETDGKDYYFLTDGEFREKINNGEFLEWEEFYNGKRYGTLRSDVEKKRREGYFILLDIDVLGAASIKKLYGDEALSIFLKPPSMEELRKRLENRRTESADSLETRLKRAGKEIEYSDTFDRVIVNDDLEQAYQQVKKAVRAFMEASAK